MISARVFGVAVLLSIVFSTLVSYFIFSGGSTTSSRESKVVAQKAVNIPNCPIEIVRLPKQSSSSLISPILFTDISCPSESFDSLKNSLSNFINSQKKSGSITSASVYLKSMKSGNWFEINGNAMYNPGSLMKVAILMTYLKDSEVQLGLLDREFVLREKVSGVLVNQIRTGPPLVVNKAYKVRDLLREMIVNSDNDATNLLNQNINRATFGKVMGDLGSRTPDLDDPNFEISAKEYARYFRVLYNASYIGRDNSAFALDLLTRSNYKGALTKNIPGNVKVAHKFGERPYEEGFNFSEGGIFYVNDDPYVVVFMTRGKDAMKLPGVIADASKMCYDFIVK